MTDHMDYDVVIVGGSFAGLAVAMQLRGRRVLVIDQYPIGAHQMSACGTPLPIAQAVAAEASIQEIHTALVLHTSNRAIQFHLRDPFVTFDYATFCQAMLSQTDAEVWQARATAFDAHRVETTRGTVTAHYVVNAAGWRMANVGHSPKGKPQISGYGLETELPVRWSAPGLHFFVERRTVRNGYGWIFPCGETTRFGIGSFDKDQKLRESMKRFLDRFGLTMGKTHGGVLAISRHQSIDNGIFVVGDAAGQCLPATGEGIRTAIFHGIHCGRALAGVLTGMHTRQQATELYRLQVHGTERFHNRLHTLQSVVVRTPETLLALAAELFAREGLTAWAIDRYLSQSGWFLGAAGSSAQPDGEKDFAWAYS